MSRRQESILRWLFMTLIMGSVLVAAIMATPANAIEPNPYDLKIQSASETWMPGTDWRRYKAQLYQESRLQPDAVSPVGAAGIAQFMPGTWDDVSQQLGFEAYSPFVPKVAIEAGAFYLSTQIQIWREPRPYLEQRRLGEASYNAGAGNIIRAQRRCRVVSCCSCVDWAPISAHLPFITGHHAEETLDYIVKIEWWLAMMELQP